MKYARIENNEVVQTQPDPQNGFIEAPAEVLPGYLYDGVTFTAPPPPSAPVPDRITKLQAKRALTSVGLYDQFKAAISDPGTDADTREDYELAVELQRTDPLVVQFGTALGLDDSALDDLFRAAARM